MNYFFHLIQPTVPVPLLVLPLLFPDNFFLILFLNQIDSRLVWDVLKIEIRDHTIMYCKNKSKLNRQERMSLEKELNVRLAKRDSMNVCYIIILVFYLIY
jgi:hypothetical protein